MTLDICHLLFVTNIFSKLVMLPRRAVGALIKLYQKTLSPDHGPLRGYYPFGACKYHPTCSEYGYQAVMKFGVIRGLPKAIWRILRCNPWSRGGYDPV